MPLDEVTFLWSISLAEQNLQTLSARQKAADIRTKLASATAGIDNASGGLAALDDLERAVNKSEAQAEATEELSASGGEALESKYAVAASSTTSDLVNEYLK